MPNPTLPSGLLEELVVKEHAASRQRSISAKVYANFLRKHVHAINGYFSKLLQAQQAVGALKWSRV